jgi:hypothetical protein
LAVLLIAPNAASASIILDRPEDVLVRMVVTPEPVPEMGPQFHMTEGSELVVYSRPQRDESVVDLFSVLTVSISFGIGLLSVVPKCQRVMIMLKLLDSR